MTPASFWLLTIVAIMADGRHISTNWTYETEANCRMAGTIISEKLQAGSVPAGATCTHVFRAEGDGTVPPAPRKQDDDPLRFLSAMKAIPAGPGPAIPAPPSGTDADDSRR